MIIKKPIVFIEIGEVTNSIILWDLDTESKDISETVLKVGQKLQSEALEIAMKKQIPISLAILIDENVNDGVKVLDCTFSSNNKEEDAITRKITTDKGFVQAFIDVDDLSRIHGKLVQLIMD